MLGRHARDDALRAPNVEEIDDRVGAAAGLRRGKASEGENPVIPAVAAQAVGEQHRQLIRPRQDGDRAGVGGHQPASAGSLRGVQMARSPPSRMKSRISCTNWCVANSSATSSTRSLRVPSFAKSSR